MDGVDMSRGRGVLGARGVIEDPSPGNVLRRDFTDYAITGSVNETRFFTPTAGGASPSAPDPDCGIMTTTSASIT